MAFGGCELSNDQSDHLYVPLAYGSNVDTRVVTDVDGRRLASQI
jgi:hypothetical protein